MRSAFGPRRVRPGLLSAFAPAIGFAFCWVAAWIETLIGNAKAAPAAT